MTKKEYLQEIYDRMNNGEKDYQTPKYLIKDLYECFVDTIRDTVAKGEDVKLLGFAAFDTIEVAERKGHNPLTGEIVVVPAHKRCRVKLQKPFKEAVCGD